MSAREHSLSKHALKVALVYFLIRGLPDFLLLLTLALPAHVVEPILAPHAAWLQYLYPVLPSYLLSVPLGLQAAIGTLPILLIETLLVYLFCAAFLRRRPGLITEARKQVAWFALILSVLLWSLICRAALLSYLVVPDIEAIQMLQTDSPDYRDALPASLLLAYWKSVPVVYGTTLLWAWVPAWLHLRAGRSMAAQTPAGSSAVPDVTSLARGSRFAGFLLGCILIQTATILAIYMGLWPWAVQQIGLHLPAGFFDSVGIVSSVGQLLATYLIFALAAHLYARRPAPDDGSPRRTAAKSILAGIAVYLLIELLALAALWLLAWLVPGLGASVLKSLERNPHTLTTWATLLAILALLPVMCIFSAGFRRSPRRWIILLAILLVCAAIPAYTGWTVAASNLGMAGGRPGLAVTGTLGDARWRSMEQWCTGVVETSHGTWLIGRQEHSSRSSAYVPQGVPDLGKLLAIEEEGANRPYSGSRDLLTTLSLLQADGTFKMVATVREVACMVVAPQSETLFLLTGLNRPRSAGTYDRQQTAVLRSTDHGASWQVLEAGMMADADLLAWSVKPTFGSDNEIWAWGSELQSWQGADDAYSDNSPRKQDAKGRVLKPTALFYSDDQGATAHAVYSPEPLDASVEMLRELTGEPEGDFSSRRDMDRNRYVVQVSDDKAYAWVSEHMWYQVQDENRFFSLTTKALLERVGGDWQVTKLERHPGRHLTHLITALDGQTHAIEADGEREWLLKLDANRGEWVDRQALPALLPAWLAKNRMWTRYFWSNGSIQVVSLWGDITLPRILAPFLPREAKVTTDAHFYSRDGGRSWKQLAIPGYLGVMGLSPKGSKLYWSQGNWYSNAEPTQLQYDLAR